MLKKHYGISGNTEGKAYIFDCKYSTLCRQVVTDDEGRVQEFDFLTDNARVQVMSTADDEDDTSYGIDSIGKNLIYSEKN